MHVRIVMPPVSAACALAGALALGAAGAPQTEPVAATPPRAGHFDETSGRDTRNYPPHPLADYLHMRLEVTIVDMNVPRLEAVQTLTVRGVERELGTLVLDANLIEVRSVLVDGVRVAHQHDGRKLTVPLAPPLRAGERREVMTAYTVSDPPDGLYWTLADPAWPGRAPQVHSQGESELNSYWFPCHDFPNDRLTTEVVATVPAGFVVCSNGRLVDRTGAAGTERWHWYQDKPHVPYLVTLVVGEFDVVDVGTPKLPMPVHVPPGRERDVRGTFRDTPRMVEFFARRFDEPYPWDQYAQVSVWNFNWGGMENTSATTLFDTAVIGRAALIDHTQEGLIAHELAHQWFGDLVTCRSWEHIWLNEGWATYAEALWYEDQRGRDAYDTAVRGSFDAVAGADTGHAPFQPSMVSREYRHPDEVFGRAANPYSKGASVLHMLRRLLGDEVFFRATAAYLDEFRLGLAETGDFRRVFERVSGESLERFFTQWCDRPGIPRLSVSLVWDAAAGELRAAVEQTQHIDERNPAFSFTLPLEVATKEGAERVEIAMDGRSAAAAVPLGTEPRFVAVDPDMGVLADLKIEAPAAWWVRQVRDSRALPSRVQAARELGRHAGADDSGVLAAVARSEREPAALRGEAIAALRARGDSEALADLFQRRVRDHETRRRLVEALGELIPSDPVLWLSQKDALLRAARSDPSQRVRAAALRAIGRSKDLSVFDVVMDATRQESQSDGLRVAAIDALADYDVAGALPAVMAMTAAGYLGDTRAHAARAAGRLGHHAPDAALATLVPLLDDRFDGVRQGAGEGLVALGDVRALAEFRRLAAAARTPHDRTEAEDWIRDLEGKAGAHASAAP